MSASLHPIPRDVIESLDAGVNPLARLVVRFRAWRAEREAATHLRRLDDRILADLGITRAEIGLFVSGRIDRG